MEIRFDDARGLESLSDDEIEEVWRYDFQDIGKAHRTAEGFLVVEGAIAKTGVFEYRVKRQDGTIGTIRELRPPRAVFEKESMATFEMAPLTLEHPPDLLNPDNVGQYQTGTVSNVRKDGEHLVADIRVNRRDAIEAIESGSARQLSAGYKARVATRPGTFVGDDGKEVRFDTVQETVLGNHVAITRKGRQGPTVALRMDSGVQVVGDTTKGKGTKTMEFEIEINGTKHKVDKVVFDAWTAVQKEKGTLEEKVRKDSEDLVELANALETLRGENATLKVQAAKTVRTDSDIQEKVTAELDNRAKLIALNEKLGGEPIKDAIRTDSADLRAALLKTHAPEMDTEGATEAYLDGVLQGLSQRVDSVAALNRGGRKDPKEQERKDSAPGGKKVVDLHQAHKQSQERTRNGYKARRAAALGGAAS